MTTPTTPATASTSDAPRITGSTRLALLMHGHLRQYTGKMGFGLLRYSPGTVTSVIDADEAGGSLREVAGIDSDAPIVADAEAAAAIGADVLVIAVATSGGVLPAGYRSEIVTALRSGMSLINGLHGRFAEDPEFAAALQPGAFIWDVRREPEGLVSGTGRARALSCRRILTVGTDMAIGKMTASLELDAESRRRGLRSRFVASGQIGMCISGDGVPLDAVRVDFASGAIESLCLRHGPDHDVLWVEGQGSALHPGSTAWIALLRGSMPTDLVLVHRAGQRHLDGLPDVAIPPLPEVIDLYERVAAATTAYPAAKVRAIALNCGHLTSEEAADAVRAVQAETGIATADVFRDGPGPLLDALFA